MSESYISQFYYVKRVNQAMKAINFKFKGGEGEKF